MKFVELTPINGRKSFYGKATAIIHESGLIELKSYDTIVAHIDNGKVVLHYDLSNKSIYSNTTRTHLRSFAATYGAELPF